MTDIKDRDLELAKDAHQRLWDMHLRVSQSAVDAGTITLRTLVLVNGGAVIAMLAFMANVADANRPDIFDSVIEALALFAFGVFAALITAAVTYFGNYASTISVATMEKIFEEPYILQTKSSQNWRTVAVILTVITVLSGMTSAGFFLIGIFSLKTSMLLAI